MDQSTWNLLFSRITGRQCFIPEGCPYPVEGIVFSAVLASVVAGTSYWFYRRREK